jgi:hypothetical protein
MEPLGMIGPFVMSFIYYGGSGRHKCSLAIEFGADKA